jgi:hypothetical protein
MEHILDEDRLLRRINFQNPDFQIKDNGIPASSNFTLKKLENGEYEKGLSVDLERLITYKEAILDVQRFRLYALIAGFVRSIGLECVNDANPHPAHSLIIGELLQKKSTARKLAQNAIRINYPL